MSIIKKISLSIYFNLLNKIIFSNAKKMISPSKGYLNYFKIKYNLNIPTEEIYFTYVIADEIIRKNVNKNIYIFFADL